MSVVGPGPNKMRFGKPYPKYYPEATPESKSWDTLDVEPERRSVVSPDAARERRPYGMPLSKGSASKRADRIGTPKPKRASSSSRNIRKRKLILDD